LPFTPPGPSRPGQAGNEKLAALHAFQRELESWNCSNSPSATGYVVEDVPIGHPLHAAVVALQPFYGGVLPKPALGHWRAFLRLARNEGEAAEDEAERLLEWVNSEIESHRDGATSSVSRDDATSTSTEATGSTNRLQIEPAGFAQLAADVADSWDTGRTSRIIIDC